ncbi:MAG: AAA family ATPase [Promethearchaeota archaeon]
MFDIKKYYNGMMPLFIMMIGIPGSGKSRWIEENINKDDFVIVSTDKIRKEITGKVSDISQDDNVWKIAKQRIKEALSNGKNAILDATNVNRKKRLEFIEGLPPCKLIAKIIDVDPKIAKKRILNDIAERVDRSHVPLDVVDLKYKEFLNESRPEQLKEDGFIIISKISDIYQL